MSRPRSIPGSGKSELSKAVRDLRERLGESQQAFSNRLGIALNTIARYETTRDPSGQALEQLSDMAFARQYPDLGYLFYFRFLEGVLGNYPMRVTSIPATDGKPSRGYLVLKLSGDDELRYARLFETLFLASRSPSLGKRADGLLLQLDKAMVEEKWIKPISEEPSTAKLRKEKK